MNWFREFPVLLLWNIQTRTEVVCEVAEAAKGSI